MREFGLVEAIMIWIKECPKYSSLYYEIKTDDGATKIPKVLIIYDQPITDTWEDDSNWIMSFDLNGWCWPTYVDIDGSMMMRSKDLQLCAADPELFNKVEAALDLRLLILKQREENEQKVEPKYDIH